MQEETEPSLLDPSDKVARILMLLMECLKLDIIIHVVDESVFYDILDIFSYMHRNKLPESSNPPPDNPGAPDKPETEPNSTSPKPLSSPDYRQFFTTQTHFKNIYNFPEQMIDSIKLRYKILFLKDYVFCDHPKDEFLAHLNEVDFRQPDCGDS